MYSNRFERIGVEAVLGAGLPAFDDIKYGYSKGFLSGNDVVALSLERMRQGVVQSSIEERVALLLSDEYSDLDSLLSPPSYDDMADPFAGPSIADSRRFWAYVRVRDVYARSSQESAPFAGIEDAYEELDLAPEIRGLVQWSPSRPGEAQGLEAMRSRLIDYLQSEAEFFARRDRAMLTQ